MPGEHGVTTADGVIRSERLVLRPWSFEDAEAALAVYGAGDVARWLSPAMDRVPDADAMRALLAEWGAEDLEVAWQLTPGAWGNGYAAEAGHAVAHHAFASGVEELFAVVRTQNGRGAATAQRVGMEWAGKTEKYYHLQLQVFRLRKGELDVASLIRVQRG